MLGGLARWVSVKRKDLSGSGAITARCARISHNGTAQKVSCLIRSDHSVTWQAGGTLRFLRAVYAIQPLEIEASNTPRLSTPHDCKNVRSRMSFDCPSHS